MVSLLIDFVSHPKIPFSLRSETSETGGSVSLFRAKKFCFVSLQFRFEAKFGDTLVKGEGLTFYCSVPVLVKREGLTFYCSVPVLVKGEGLTLLTFLCQLQCVYDRL